MRGTRVCEMRGSSVALKVVLAFCWSALLIYWVPPAPADAALPPSLHVGQTLRYEAMTVQYLPGIPMVRIPGTIILQIKSVGSHSVRLTYSNQGAHTTSVDDVTFYDDGSSKTSRNPNGFILPFLADRSYSGPDSKLRLVVGASQSFTDARYSEFGLPGPRTVTVTAVKGDVVDLHIKGSGEGQLGYGAAVPTSRTGQPLLGRDRVSAVVEFRGGVLESETIHLRSHQQQPDGHFEYVPTVYTLTRERP